MKRFLIICLALVICAPVVNARRKQKRAGTITDNVYHDDTYGFELTLPENWKASVNKDSDHARLILTQKNPDIPNDYIDAEDYTYTPRLVVYVDTTSFGVHTFIDSLTSDEFDSDQKGDILKEFDFLNERDRIPRRRSRLELAGESAVLWNAQANYFKEISTSVSSVSGKRVRRKYGGSIAAVKIGDNIILFQVMTEWEFFDAVMAEVLPMIKSLKVPQSEDEG